MCGENLKEFQSRNDFMSMHRQGGHKKHVGFLKEQGSSVEARLVMKHFNTWKDESDELYAGAPTAVSFVPHWASHEHTHAPMFPLHLSTRRRETKSA